MDKEQLSYMYCDKMQNIISDMIQKAFTEGYEKGVASQIKNFNIDGVEYFDPGLPSGTLWSCALQHFDYGWHLVLATYEQVAELNLPTKEQWEELCEHCIIKKKKLITPSGYKLGYPTAKNGPSNRYTTYTLGEECEKGRNKFWLKSTPTSHQADVVVFDVDVNEFSTHFTGFKLPFFLVKNKSDLKTLNLKE